MRPLASGIPDKPRLTTALPVVVSLAGKMGAFTRWKRTAGSGVLLAALGLTSAMTVSGSAWAQTQEELERARGLFREGLSLEAAGNWAGALSKFEGVAKVKLTPQVRFHIARCKENLGRLTEALGDYRLAEYEAQQAELAEAGAIAEAREKLAARIPKLTIQRGEGAEAARVELDGVELGGTQLGRPVAVDPGPHRIVAVLPDQRSFAEAVNVQEGETKAVELVRPDDLAPAAPTGNGGAEPAAGAEQPQGAGGTAADSGVEAKGGLGPWPWVAGGLGVASLGASGAFFFLRKDAERTLDDTCRGSVCPESARSTQDKGQLYSTLSTVGLGVGVVGLGVATYLFIAHGRSGGGDEHARLVDVDVMASPRATGVRVRGRF